MQTRILTLSAAVPFRAAFNYLADIENLPAWSGGFCEWIELRPDGWWAYTAVGELAVETKVDDIAREIDLCLRHVLGWTMVIPLRVSSDGDHGALITAVCRQSTAMANESYELLFESILLGLRTLPAKLPNQLAEV